MPSPGSFIPWRICSSQLQKTWTCAFHSIRLSWFASLPELFVNRNWSLGRVMNTAGSMQVKTILRTLCLFFHFSVFSKDGAMGAETQGPYVVPRCLEEQRCERCWKTTLKVAPEPAWVMESDTLSLHARGPSWAGNWTF